MHHFGVQAASGIEDFTDALECGLVHPPAILSTQLCIDSTRYAYCTSEHGNCGLNRAVAMNGRLVFHVQGWRVVICVGKDRKKVLVCTGVSGSDSPSALPVMSTNTVPTAQPEVRVFSFPAFFSTS